MSYKEALNFFKLNELYTEKELKNRYYKLALKNHPDNSNNTDNVDD